MADWLPSIGLLSDSSLQGIDEATRNKLQSEATGRFLLSSILSGRPDIGFQHAVGTANDYVTSQTRLLDLAEKQRQQQAEDAWTAKYNPTKYQETSPEFAGPVTPDVSAYQTGIARARAVGLPTADVNAALRDLTTMRSPRQAAMLEGFKASLPKMGEGGTLISPSGQYLGTIPQFNPAQGIIYGTKTDELGRIVPFSQEIPDAVKTRGRIVATETQARELNTPRQVPGASGAPTFIYPTAPAGTGLGGAGSGSEKPQTASDVALNKGAQDRYDLFNKASSEAALTSSDRRLAAQQMYDLAGQIKNNKLTGLKSEAYSYLNALPVVGGNFEQYSTDVTRLNQIISQGQLAGSGKLKGSASDLEQKMIAKGYASLNDPAAATRMLAAQEEALADKDDARARFVAGYKGDPGNIQAAWQNSPDNPRIYNHPKIEQFLREQIASNPAKPVLPAGFSLVQNKDKQYGVRKPDGSVMPLQMGQ